MNIYEMLGLDLATSGVVIVSVLTLVQIAPIKLNPWSWIAKKIGKSMNGELIEDVKLLRKELACLKRKIDDDDALSARRRILVFNKEIVRGVLHDESEFNEILLDIDSYEKYCKEHEDFPNNRGKSAMKNIKNTYNRLLDSHEFATY